MNCFSYMYEKCRNIIKCVVVLVRSTYLLDTKYSLSICIYNFFIIIICTIFLCY